MKPHEFDNMMREQMASDPLPVKPEWLNTVHNEDGTYTTYVHGEGKTYRLDGRKWVEAE
jgi:hypothetical protein